MVFNKVHKFRAICMPTFAFTSEFFTSPEEFKLWDRLICELCTNVRIQYQRIHIMSARSGRYNDKCIYASPPGIVSGAQPTARLYYRCHPKQDNNDCDSFEEDYNEPTNLNKISTPPPPPSPPPPQPSRPEGQKGK